MNLSAATVAVWLVFAQPASLPQPAPAKCCAKCNGTGMVLTGDSITRVPCECPATCPCAKNRPKVQCKDGKCPQ